MSTPTPLAYVRDTYGVPAALGRRVTVDGKPGVIAEDRGHYIGVNFDQHQPGHILPCHPTWRVVYGDLGKVRRPSRGARLYAKFRICRAVNEDLTFRHFLTSPNYAELRASA